MSVPRSYGSLAKSICKSTFSTVSFVNTRCYNISRTCTTTTRIQFSSKREIQTATAYHPRTLDTLPPPPRNAGIPNSSIAGTVPEVNDTRPPRLTGQYDQHVPGQGEERQSVGITEKEAQKSKPVFEITDGLASPPEAAKPKRSKLRARKAAMSLTPSAAAHIRSLLEQPEPKMIRVGVKNRGCSGLSYSLEYVEKPGAFDETVEQDDVKILIDSKALFSIIGSEMDWVEDKLSQRFVFRNPNISMC